VIVTDPTGVIEPDWLGQMFFDHVNHVFYQARDLTKDGWRFVPPADFNGAFPKVYDQFLGNPETDPQDAGAWQRHHDTIAVRATFAMSGVEILGLGGLFWTTANGWEVFQVRLRFRQTHGFSLFAGLAERAWVVEMPHGDGFTFRDGVLRCWNGETFVRPGSVVALRLVWNRGIGAAYVNDESFAAARNGRGTARVPVLALFDLHGGPRPVAPGYDGALKRNTDKHGGTDGNGQAQDDRRGAGVGKVPAAVPGTGPADPPGGAG
jgi:hypothetical protein